MKAQQLDKALYEKFVSRGEWLVFCQKPEGV